MLGCRLQKRIWAVVAVTFLTSSFFQLTTKGDQIETQSGDRYTGKVLSMNGETVVLQNDVLGTVRLPREKIAQIRFGTNAPASNKTVEGSTNRITALASSAQTSPATDLSTSLRQLGTNSNVIQQVRSQFLNGAGGEANSKFDELLSGYLSGKLTVNDIRKQALSAVDQLRDARKDLGESAGPMLDSYLAILNSFLKETEPTDSSVTNVPPAPSKSKSGAATQQ